MPQFKLSQRERGALGERLRAARYVAGLTIAEVAVRTNVSSNSVMSWEHGSVPQPKTRAELAAVYGVPEEVLFAEVEAKSEAARRLLSPL